MSPEELAQIKSTLEAMLQQRTATMPPAGPAAIAGMMPAGSMGVAPTTPTAISLPVQIPLSNGATVRAYLHFDGAMIANPSFPVILDQIVAMWNIQTYEPRGTQNWPRPAGGDGWRNGGNAGGYGQRRTFGRRW